MCTICLHSYCNSCLISFLPCFLVELIHATAKASPLKCGVPGCAACSGVQISILNLRFARAPMPWVSAPSVRPQLSDSWQLSTKSVHLCNQAKPMRSPENTQCPRAPRTADTRSRPAGAVIPSGCKIICTAAKTSQ